MNEATIGKKLSSRNKWCYSVGGLRDMMYTLVSMFLIQYIQYTMELTNLQFVAISVIMVLCRVWDAVNDPMMGTIIENARLKSGKYRPWILIGAATNSVVTICLFTIRPSGWAFVALFGVLYLLWGMTYTMNDVSFWALLPNLTNSAKDRDGLTTLMNVFCSIGAFMVAGLLPMLINGNMVLVFAIASVVISVVFFLLQLMTFVGVKEPPRPPANAENKVTLRKMVKIIKNNDQLLWITLVMLFYYLASGMLLAFGANFCNFEFGYSSGGSVLTFFTVVYAVGTLLSQMLYPVLTKRLKRKGASTVGIIFIAIGYILLLGFGYVFPRSIIIVLVSAFCVFFGQGVFYLVVLVEATNTIEYNELKTGQRNEPIIFSLRSFLAKATSALQQALLSIILVLSGIKVLSDKIAALEIAKGQGLITGAEVAASGDMITATATDGMLLALRIGMVLVPLVLMIIAYLINRAKYKINEEEYEIITKELERRNAEASEENV